MATKIGSLGLQHVARAENDQPIGGLRFDWMIVGVSSWFLGGLFLDGWAHTHIPQLETFFTPWHAVFYSGFLAVAVFLGISVFRNHARGFNWLHSVPEGYELSVLGAIIFAVSGVGDLIWHLLFGIERTVEALLSPTHLGLALGIALIVSGPLRAAWRRSDSDTSWRALLPMLLSVTFLFSLLTFFTEYAHPFVHLWPAIPASNPRFSRDIGPTLGIDGILLQTGLLMGFVFFVIRRWQSLPIGAFTMLFALNVALMSVFTRTGLFEVPVALLAGLVADVLLRVLKPSESQPTALRLFGFIVPSVLYLLYFLYIIIAGLFLQFSLSWSIHLWLGSVVLAGVVGLLMSYLVVPPIRPLRLN